MDGADVKYSQIRNCGRHVLDQKKLTDRGHRDQAAKNSDTLIGEKNDSGDLSSPEGI